MIDHPGVTLLKRIENEGMTQKELAVRTGVSEKHISTIINGEKKISTTFARKLGYVFPDDDWLKLQYEYDKDQLKIQKDHGITDEELGVLKPLKEVIQYLLEQNYIHTDCSDVEKVLQLRTFLGISNLSNIPNITFNGAYRAQLKNCICDPYVVYAWQRICEKKTESLEVNQPLNIEKLKNSITVLRQASNLDISIAVQKVQRLLMDCGIAFSVVPNFRGAPVQGFIKQNPKSKTVLCLTIRGKRADTFWFTLFHEIGHIVNGDFSKRLVDFDSDTVSPAEERANHFAKDTLIDPDKYKRFVMSGNYTTWTGISKFANEIEIPSYIVLGRLQNDKHLDWADFSNRIEYLSDSMINL